MNKKILLIATAIACCSAFVSEAQLRIKPAGYLVVGPDSIENQVMAGQPENRRDTITAIKIYGRNVFGSGGRISFGDQSHVRRALSVIVGELSEDHDTDRLWLHGKHGVYVTDNSHASDTVFYFDNDRDAAVNFNYPIKSQGVLLASDERFKEDVRDVNDALVVLSDLRGVSYRYKDLEPGRYNPSLDADGGPLDEKELRDKQFFDRFYSNLESNRQQQRHYGFLAQELEQVLPDLVHRDNDGNMYVNYLGIIPLLVNAVNQLSSELEAVKEREGQHNAPAVNQAPAQSHTEDLLSDHTAEVLGQNKPNPFTDDTVINYNLPEGTQSASIFVYNLQGQQLMELPIAQMDAGCVTINGSSLQAGMYIYALVADGRELGAKRMILTR
ncbi:MAG: tail fiber domain-containing protein [Muribaculaceae bacterium]|nr:tail fiber domain-containing protein [Muribaculaceae bacterium]